MSSKLHSLAILLLYLRRPLYMLVKNGLENLIKLIDKCKNTAPGQLAFLISLADLDVVYSDDAGCQENPNLKPTDRYALFNSVP